MTSRVRSFKRKFDGTSKRDRAWDGDIVEKIGDRWLVVYFRRPGHRAGAASDEAEHALAYAGMDCPLSVFISFDAHGRLIEYQCDAGYPAEIEGDELSFVDLDLDLIVRPGEMAFERDFDDFASRRRTMCYSPDAIQTAYRGLALAHRLVDARECPFDGSPAMLLDRILAAGCGV